MLDNPRNGLPSLLGVSPKATALNRNDRAVAVNRARRKVELSPERGEAALRDALRLWRQLRPRRVGGVDTTPQCLHGVIVQNGLDELRGDLEDIKKELAWIRRVIVAAVVSAAIGTLLRLGGLLQ